MACELLPSPSGNHDADCAAALEQALTLAPFYEPWRGFDARPELPVNQRFASLPILTKRDLRFHMPQGFVPRNRDWKSAVSAGEVELVTTSGTTDERAAVVWFQPWWDESERTAASLRAGFADVMSAGPREAVLTTPLCAGNVCHTGHLTMAERTLGRLLFLNQNPDPNHWITADQDRMLDELAQFQPQIIEADPAYLALLSRHALQSQTALFRPRFIVLTYEFPSRLHLRDIRRAFGETPIVSSYGSTETGHVFLECEYGRFHQNLAFCRVDFQPLRPAHGGPKLGRLLISALRHPWLALLRFDVGDLACRADAECPCGRHEGLTLAAIEGRVRDLTFAVDGRAVTPNQLDNALADLTSLRAYQLVQETPTRIAFHFVADPGTETQVSQAGVHSLRELYGRGLTILAQRESAIPVMQSGKFRLAQTRFSWDAEALFEPSTALCPSR